MISKLDTYRVAHMLLKQHGADGAIAWAEQRAKVLAEQGEAEDAAVFVRIAAAVKALVRAPGEDDTKH